MTPHAANSTVASCDSVTGLDAKTFCERRRIRISPSETFGSVGAGSAVAGAWLHFFTERVVLTSAFGLAWSTYVSVWRNASCL